MRIARTAQRLGRLSFHPRQQRHDTRGTTPPRSVPLRSRRPRPEARRARLRRGGANRRRSRRGRIGRAPLSHPKAEPDIHCLRARCQRAAEPTAARRRTTRLRGGTRRQLAPADALRKAEIVLDHRRCARLSSGRDRFDRNRSQSLGCGIHRRRQPRGTGADDREVVVRRKRRGHHSEPVRDLLHCCPCEPPPIGQHANRKSVRIDIAARTAANAIRIVDFDPVVGHTIAAEKVTKFVPEPWWTSPAGAGRFSSTSPWPRSPSARPRRGPRDPRPERFGSARLCGRLLGSCRPRRGNLGAHRSRTRADGRRRQCSRRAQWRWPPSSASSRIYSEQNSARSAGSIPQSPVHGRRTS